MRRLALLSQLKMREATDRELLFELCTRCAHEQDFFIRKAIGWVLRQYARTDPESVREYLAGHADALSALSVREASRHL